MKRYFDLHTQKVVAMLEIESDSPASKTGVDSFKKYFSDDDTREITLYQYRRLKVQYEQE